MLTFLVVLPMAFGLCRFVCGRDAHRQSVFLVAGDDASMGVTMLKFM
jgi:hypothetical protein